MSESIRDLAGWYPFLPADGAVPDIAKLILDMRVCVKLTPGDIAIHGPGVTAVDVCRAVVFATSQNIVHVRVFTPRMQSDYGQGPVSVDIDIPVYSSRYAVPDGCSSYAISSATLPERTLANPYEIHPDCLVIMQSSPDFWVTMRGSVNSNDATPQPGGGRQDGSAGHWVNMYQCMSFESGFNVSVSGADSTLTYTGAARAGAGPWTTSPFADIPNWNLSGGTGLRSINGQTGAVMLEGSPSITVDVHEEIDDDTGQQTIVVELQPVKASN